MRGEKKAEGGDLRILAVILCALALAFMVSQFFVSAVRVVGPSMEPALRENDWLLLQRRADPAPGDIVVLRKPEVTAQPIVKRIAGCSGDTLEIRAGVLYRNGNPVYEGFSGSGTDNMAPLTVPSGCYFVLGDNAEASSDSRCWDSPFVEKAQILGKAFVMLFPRIQNLS